jgi:FKBP-type peptidyl-prolyl cis-trans isomerase FklB
MQNSFKKNNAAVFLLAILATGALIVSSAIAQQSQPAGSPSTSQSGAKTSKPASSSTAAKSTSASSAKTTANPLPSDKDKTSYALGSNIGRQLSQEHITPDMIDPASLSRGLRDALLGNKSLLTDDQIKALLAQLQSSMNAKAQAASQAIGEENLKKGEEFLAENKTKAGVVTTPSGLQYKVLTMGTGPKPAASDTVVCDYSGTLIDGKEFDSSYKRGQSATFPVSGVIKGWTEALQMMPVGSKWELYIPPELAYGGRGAGADIGPNATLIFQVELHSIKGK